MKYRFKTKPYKHQVAGLRKLIENGYGGALLMDPRTGKTKTAIDYMCIEAQRANVSKWLVIAPSRVLDVWVQELFHHATIPYEVVVWDAEARKAKTPAPRSSASLKVLLINYEAFATPGRKLASGRRSKTTGRFATRTAIEKWVAGDLAGCIADESHKISKPSGKAASMIVGMRKLFVRRVILTGTVLRKANRVTSIYMQWRFLNDQRFKDTPTSREFNEEYARWTHHNGYPQFLGPRNQDELRKRIHQDAYAITRREALDMPDPTPRIHHIRLTSSRPIYDRMAAEMIAQLKNKDYVEATLPIVQVLRLAQITGGVAKGTDTDKLYRIGSEKLDALEGYWEEAVDHDEKIVVAARFKADLNSVRRRAEAAGLKTFRIQGGMKRAESDASVRQFKEYNGPAVIAVQPQAGSTGIDLSSAGLLIWYSMTPVWVDFKQMTDRIALHPTATIVHLLAEHSVDEVLYATLKNDGDVARYVSTHPDKLIEGISLP